MDTKWKKSKMTIGFISWFAGIVLMAVNIFGLLLEIGYHEKNFMEYARGILQGDYEETLDFKEFMKYRMSDFIAMSVAEPGHEKKAEGSGNEQRIGDWNEQTDWEVTEEDYDFAEEFGLYEDDVLDMGAVYQYYDYYSNGYGSRYDVAYNGKWNMDKEEADEIHGRLQYDTNILYRIERNGEVLYSNYEDLGYAGDGSAFDCIIDIGGENSFAMPEGYNYLVYFDGTSLRTWKNGRELEVKVPEAEFDFDDGWYIPGYGNIPADEAYTESKVYMAVARIPEIIIKRNFNGNGKDYYSNQLYRIYIQSLDMAAVYRNWIYSFFAALILTAAGLSLRTYRKEAYERIARVTGRFWYEVKLIPVLAVFAGFGLCVIRFLIKMGNLWWDVTGYIYELSYEMHNLYSIWGFFRYGTTRTIAVVAVFIICSCVLWLFDNDVRYNKKSWENSVLRKIICLFQTSMLKLPFAKRMVWYSVWVFLLGGLSALLPVTISLADRRGNVMLLAAFVLCACILSLQFLFVRSMRRMAVDMDCLAGQIEAVHNGNLWEDVEVSEESGLSGAMENLKDIRNGMNKAIEEQIKSERMKVELIANVSHDIKTPLTSIISYVELLRQEDGLPGHVREYISILENKSQRLKAMVQDVFEVSKAASGELPVHMEDLDFGKLIRQTMADMQEEIAVSAVSIKCEIPDSAVMIHADGDRLYRVFQNLIQNALKYSLEGSRIYICLKISGSQAVADVKNTSKEEIPPDMDFTERFIRGDKSRTDGGSGLGLSIAQSFTEACGGTFRVEAIADLFVVTVTFEVVSKNFQDP